MSFQLEYTRHELLHATCPWMLNVTGILSTGSELHAGLDLVTTGTHHSANVDSSGLKVYHVL